MSAVVRPLEGRVRVVSDKSLTHRGVLLGACAEGRTVLARPNFGADCRATLRAVERLGVGVEIEEDAWVLDGGKSRLHEPPDVLDLENSGTGMRLLAGVASGVAGLSVLTGDASLRRRPMRRITDPLEAMGARISCRTGGQAPLAITGGALHAIDWKSEAASAQVKSAVLLAGLWVNSGTIRFEEPASSRDHTERLLAYLGAAVEHRPRFVALHGGASLRARSWSVPADPSAAAFFAVAATLVPGSALELTDVALNPTRLGALSVLQRMGAKIRIEPSPAEGPEPVGTVLVEHASLRGVVVEPEEVPHLLDEVPVLAVAAARAEGRTELRGIGELRVKESDRIASTAALVEMLGASVEVGPDWMVVTGVETWRGGAVRSEGDHRIAMAALIAGLVTRDPLEVDDLAMIATSDPTFLAQLASLTGGRS